MRFGVVLEILLIGAAGAGWTLALLANRRAVRRQHRSGRPGDGVVLFVEPVRWLFIIWGFVPFCRGLRRAGCGCQVRLFRWGTGAGSLLVVPDLIGRSRLQRKAERLARRIERIAAEHPGCPIHLVGYSSGCYVVLEACRAVACPDALGQVILLAGSVSPNYPLGRLAGRVRELHSFHSCFDLITGVGHAVFGTNDRCWGPACGAQGFRRAPTFVVQRAWRPADIRLGYLGGHFTVTGRRFVAREIAPLLSR